METNLINPDQLVEADDYEGIPTSLIVRNIPPELYNNDQMKEELTAEISKFATPKNTIYLPSFKRVRLDFATSQEAYYVRTRLSIFKFYDNVLNVFFIEPENLGTTEKKSTNSVGQTQSDATISTTITENENLNEIDYLKPKNLPSDHEDDLNRLITEENDRYYVASPRYPEPDKLQPPKKTRNFLISPPASPPEGWEQVRETRPKPGIEVEILAKLCELKPGMTHELIAQNKKYNSPSICVHVCEETEEDQSRQRNMPGRRILQTKRPPIS